MMVVPQMMVTFRPNFSPQITVERAPKKQPTGYTAVIVPISSVFPWRLNTSRKSFVTMTPAMTLALGTIHKEYSRNTEDTLIAAKSVSLVPWVEKRPYLIVSKQAHICGTCHCDPKSQPSPCEAEIRLSCSTADHLRAIDIAVWTG